MMRSMPEQPTTEPTERSHRPRCVMLILGTRPEAIKLGPVYEELRGRAGSLPARLVLTGQHREMVAPFLPTFGMKPQYDLQVMQEGQSLWQLTSRIIAALEEPLAAEKPDVVVVQGDTASAFCGALAAFHSQIPSAHVEAGLRSHIKYDPFPEEMYRRMISRLADVHFAPTPQAKANLLAEGIPDDRIHVTGNTAIDAVLSVAQRSASLAGTEFEWVEGYAGRIILVTAHRRESLGERHERVFKALRKLAAAHEDVTVLYPMHLSPRVRQVAETMLGGAERVVLAEPPDYHTFVTLMGRSHLIITDSGGIQEEAPALGKPVLVVRETSERPEGIATGALRLVGTDTGAIVDAAELLLTDEQEYQRMARAPNPYGDGHAAARICDGLEHFLGLSERRPTDFVSPLPV